jgi:hypothetical protein
VKEAALELGRHAEQETHRVRLALE